MFGAIGLVGKGKSPHSVRVSSRCNNYPLNNEARQSDKHRGLEYLSKIETLLNDACQLAFFSLGQNQGEAGTPTGGSHHSRLVINPITNYNYKSQLQITITKTKPLSRLAGKRD